MRHRALAHRLEGDPTPKREAGLAKHPLDRNLKVCPCQGDFIYLALSLTGFPHLTRNKGGIKRPFGLFFWFFSHGQTRYDDDSDRQHEESSDGHIPCHDGSPFVSVASEDTITSVACYCNRVQC